MYTECSELFRMIGMYSTPFCEVEAKEEDRRYWGVLQVLSLALSLTATGATVDCT